MDVLANAAGIMAGQLGSEVVLALRIRDQGRPVIVTIQIVNALRTSLPDFDL